MVTILKYYHPYLRISCRPGASHEHWRVKKSSGVKPLQNASSVSTFSVDSGKKNNIWDKKKITIFSRFYKTALYSSYCSCLVSHRYSAHQPAYPNCKSLLFGNPTPSSHFISQRTHLIAIQCHKWPPPLITSGTSSSPPHPISSHPWSGGHLQPPTTRSEWITTRA